MPFSVCAFVVIGQNSNAITVIAIVLNLKKNVPESFFHIFYFFDILFDFHIAQVEGFKVCVFLGS